VVELDDGHDDKGDQKMIFKCSNLEKKKEKQNRLKTKVFLLGHFVLPLKTPNGCELI